MSKETLMPQIIKEKSFFLFAPSAVGKSHLIRHTLKGPKVYNLLDPIVLRDLSRNPGPIEQRQNDWETLIVIDEIQKLPSILDEVHRLIEEYAARFLLTGSSAKKLRSEERLVRS